MMVGYAESKVKTIVIVIVCVGLVLLANLADYGNAPDEDIVQLAKSSSCAKRLLSSKKTEVASQLAGMESSSEAWTNGDLKIIQQHCNNEEKAEKQRELVKTL